SLPMKIANFYIRNTFAGWYAVGGYNLALDRLGLSFYDVPFPGNQVQSIEHVMKQVPSLELLKECDCILIHSFEYVQPWLAAIYGPAWKELKVPIIARFDESMDRQ